MKFTNVDQVINRIYSLPKLHPKNDLSYVKRILKQLNNPQDSVKTIHVTGTNGKGSTSYYLSNLLQKAGQKTGLFVSPYIYEFNERIQLNGKNISNRDLVEVANKIEAAIKELKKTDPDFSLVTFEYEVALAFQFFAQKKCDYAVIEVGIGGEHDKTNVITPEVSIITTIGLDHEKIIGPTLADIAKEKSGIIKQNKPVVLGNIPQDVLDILLDKAQAEKSKSFLLGRDFKIKLSKTAIEYQDLENKYQFLKRPVVEAYDIVQTAPKIIVDGAHNLQAMTNLLHLIRKENQGQIYILLGMMKDKDLGPVTNLFEDEKVTLTRIDYPRAARLEDFPKEAQQKYNYEENFEVAYTNLKNKLKPHDILLVTGSFYLVGAVLNYCKRGKK